MRRLLATADVFYDRSIAGIGALPRSCRPGIHAARLIYAEIGREVARGGFDSVSRRAVVSSQRKLQLLADGFAASLSPRTAMTDVVESAASPVIAAVGASPPPAAAQPRKSIVARAVWVIDLFERLAQRDQVLRGGQAP